jgi:hypothetical protein
MMSVERELLKEFIDFVDSYEFYPTERNIIWEIVNRANAILAQPEQKPLSDEQKRLAAIAIKQREVHGIGGEE